MGLRPWLWRGLVSKRANRLGALYAWPLGLGRAVGLDLDRRRALGLCAVPLRALGVHRRSLVLGPGNFRAFAGLRTGARRLSRRARGGAIYFGGDRAAGRMVSARARRGL